MKRALAVVVLVGCGRLHFDDVAAGDAPAAGDAFNLTTDAPQGATIVSFGEAPGTTYRGVTRDTFIWQASPTFNYGVAPYAYVTIASPRVGLLRFELFALPITTVVVAAELHFTTQDSAPTLPAQIYEVLEPWTEGGKNGSGGWCDWDQSQSGVSWKAVGAGAPLSRSAQPMASFLPGPGGTSAVVPLNAVGLAAVQGWIHLPDSNHGMALADSDSWAYATKEAGFEVTRPVLVLAIE